MFPEEVVLHSGPQSKVLKTCLEREEEHFRWRKLGSSGPNMHESLTSRESMAHSRTSDQVNVARERARPLTKGLEKWMSRHTGPLSTLLESEPYSQSRRKE